MNGQRVHPNLYGFLRLPEGGFGCDLRGRWWIRPPASNAVIVDQRDVIEHRNETITVSGFLNNGIWRTA